MALPTAAQAKDFAAEIESIYVQLRNLSPYAFNRDFVAWSIIAYLLNNGGSPNSGVNSSSTNPPGLATTSCSRQEATNQIAAVDLTAVTGKKNVIEGIVTSASGGTFPAAGMTVTVTSGATTVMKYTLTEKGVAPISMNRLASATGEAMKVELSAGGAGVKGEVNVFWRLE